MIVYLDGQYLPREQARIDPFDRGFIFGDGVYEGLRSVPAASGARVVGLARHINRMQHGLNEAGIGYSAAAFDQITGRLLGANGLTDAFVYWHVTGGNPGSGDPVRSRVPGSSTRPTVFAYAESRPPLSSLLQPPTKRVISTEDVRWELGWLKSISLMGNVFMAKIAAKQGCDEAILTRRGLVSEGLATNVFLGFADGRVATPSLDSAPMLAGVTRGLLVDWDPTIEQRPVQISELTQASELMLVGTTTYVTSITHLDGRIVGNGTPGPLARRLLDLLIRGIQAGRDIEPLH